MNFLTALTIPLALAGCSFFNPEPAPASLLDSCFTGLAPISAKPVVTRGDRVWNKLPALEEILEDLETGDTLTAEAALGVMFRNNLSILTPSLAGQIVVQNEILRRNCK